MHWLEKLSTEKRNIEFVDLDSDILRDHVSGFAFSQLYPGIDAKGCGEIVPPYHTEFLSKSNGAHIFIPSARGFPDAQSAAIHLFSLQEIVQHSTWLASAVSSNRKLSSAEWESAADEELEESEYLEKELRVIGFWGAPGDLVVATFHCSDSWSIGVLYACDYEAGGPLTSFHISRKARSLAEFVSSACADWPKNLPDTYQLCDANGRQFVPR